MESIANRANIRGLRKCKACNFYNGFQANGCKNRKCSLYQSKSKKGSPNIDAIQIITEPESNLYSVRVRERCPDNIETRSFVKITDKAIETDGDATIIHRNAICYVDTCKYDSKDIEISCKHVKGSCGSDVQSVGLALKKEILFGIKILSDEEKTSLWQFIIGQPNPVCQRLNKTMFVVTTEIGVNSPTGYFHVQFTRNDHTGAKYSCACKKIKITFSSNDMIVMQNEICHHLIIVLTAILSDEKLKETFKEHVKLLALLYSSEENIGSQHNGLLNDYEDWPILTGTLMDQQADNYGTVSSSDNAANISLTDINLNTEIEFITSCSDENNLNYCTMNAENLIGVSDTPGYQTTENILDNNSLSLDSHSIILNEYPNQNLELTDCQIELMDQFKLTDQIDLCDNDIQIHESDLLTEQSNLLETTNRIFSLELEGVETCRSFPVIQGINEHQPIAKTIKKSLLKPFHKSKTILKRPKLSAEKRRNNILCNAKLKTDNNLLGIDLDLESGVTLAFENWLDSVIERINLVFDFNKSGKPCTLVFSVSHTFFSYLHNRFSEDGKKRLPNKSYIIKDDEYKGLAMNAWLFCRLPSIIKIFSTRNMKIEPVKLFELKAKNLFIPVFQDDIIRDMEHSYNPMRKIKPTEYKTYLKLGPQENGTRAYFTIEWIANVLPRSKHGEMKLIFEFGHKKNDKIIAFSEIKNM